MAIGQLVVIHSATACAYTSETRAGARRGSVDDMQVRPAIQHEALNMRMKSGRANTYHQQSRFKLTESPRSRFALAVGVSPVVEQAKNLEIKELLSDNGFQGDSKT